jgi:hypothetical protein
MSKTSIALALTIVIPTFNRYRCLRLLLNTLKLELLGLEGRVAVVIGDNASTDDTRNLTLEFASCWRDTLILRHETNVGAEENFCRCIERVSSKYFWIIGDDDLPRAGLISAIFPLLDSEEPDLLYLNSRWSQNFSGHEEIGRVKILSATLMGRREFARSIHIWFTFVSSFVVKRSLAHDSSLRRFSIYRLVQLDWIFRGLSQGVRFIHIASPCVLATSGNSGGYSALKVFGNYFQSVTREALSGDIEHREMAEDIIRRASIAYLPSLVWGLRQVRANNFLDTKNYMIANLEPQLGSSIVYWLILRPLSSTGPFIGRVLLLVSRFAAFITALFDILRARLNGSIRAL